MRRSNKYLTEQEMKVKNLVHRYYALRKAVISYGKFAVTAAIGLTFGEAIKGAVSFEAAMSKVLGITGATEEEMKALGDQAKQLGLTTQFSATQAAEGMSFLAQAGYTVNQILESMPGVLNLAAAGQLELGAAADIVSNVLSGFGLEARETGRLVDVLAAAATSSNTNVEQMAEALKYAGPIARSVGLSVEATAAAIGLLGDNGIQGSDAGTQLRGVLLALAKPSDEAADLLERLGVQTRDAAGEMRPMVAIWEDLGTAQLDAAAAATLFRRTSSAAGLILTQGTDAVKTQTKALEDSEGRASKLAKVIQDNLGGAWREFLSAVGALGIEIFESGVGDLLYGLIKAATVLLRLLVKVFEVTSDVYERVKEAVQYIPEWFVRLAGLGPDLANVGVPAAAPKARSAEAQLRAVGAAQLKLAEDQVKALARTVMSAEARLALEDRIRRMLAAQVDLVGRQVELRGQLFDDEQRVFGSDDPMSAARDIVRQRGLERDRLLTQLQSLEAGGLTAAEHDAYVDTYERLEDAERRLAAANDLLAGAQARLKKSTEEVIPPFSQFNELVKERKDLLALTDEEALALVIEHSIPPLKEANNLMWKLSDGTKAWLTDITSGLKAATLQFETWSEIVNAWLKNLAVTGGDIFGRILLSQLFPKHGQSILAGLPGFASGGVIPAGQPAIVGEKGPEFLLRSTATRVVPMDQIGGPVNLTVAPVFNADVRDKAAMVEEIKYATLEAVHASMSMTGRRNRSL